MFNSHVCCFLCVTLYFREWMTDKVCVEYTCHHLGWWVIVKWVGTLHEQLQTSVWEGSVTCESVTFKTEMRSCII